MGDQACLLCAFFIIMAVFSSAWQAASWWDFIFETKAEADSFQTSTCLLGIIDCCP